MKTFLKMFAVLVTMNFVFYGVVSAQEGVYFYNGTSWIAAEISGVGYKNPSIAGIAGDTLLVGYKLSNGSFYNVEWSTEDPVNGNVIPFDTAETICAPILNTLNIINYIVRDSTGSNDLTSFFIYPKFIPPTLLLDSSGNKSLSALLTLADFDIIINAPAGGYSAYCDSICWYRNDTLIHTGIDTSYIADLSGDYSIKAKIVYVTKFVSDSCIYTRWNSSNKLTIFINNQTTYVENNLSQKIFNVYPNPATTDLYLSSETTFWVFSINGEEILEGTGNKINVSNFKSGVYVLKTLVGDTKFIVK
jgi:hypothetical protein